MSGQREEVQQQKGSKCCQAPPPPLARRRRRQAPPPSVPAQLRPAPRRAHLRHPGTIALVRFIVPCVAPATCMSPELAHFQTLSTRAWRKAGM